MTVAVVSITNSYTGDGATNAYNFTFPVFSSADLQITITSPTGTSYSLILGTDYTVAGLNPSGGPPTTGTITLASAGQAWLTGGFLTTGWTISITRNMALAQNTSFRNGGDFYPEAHENALDYLMMVCQQLSSQIATLQSQVAAPPTSIPASFPMRDANSRTWTISIGTDGRLGST